MFGIGMPEVAVILVSPSSSSDRSGSPKSHALSARDWPSFAA